MQVAFRWLLFLYFLSSTKSSIFDDLYSKEVVIDESRDQACNDINTSLDLSNTDLSKFREEVPLSLKCLRLKNCGLTSYNFINLKNLTYLNLENNKLTPRISGDPQSNVNLKILVLDNAYDTSESTFSIEPRNNLEKLYLRNNGIKLLKINGSFHQPVLTHLYLDNNQIKKIMWKIVNTWFDDDDYFDWLPTSLKLLQLDSNEFVRLSLQDRHKLECISINNNPLKTLELVHMWNLQYISATNVSLNKLTLISLSKLKEFSTSGNQLDQILISDIHTLPSLKALSLANNSISFFDGTIATFLPSLEKIDLSWNRIRNIPEIKEEPALEILILSHNEIDNLHSQDFRAMRRLKFLYLDHNHIQKIESGTFKSLENLRELNLQNNNLKNLPAEWMSPLKNLENVILNDNSFTNVEALSLNETLLQKVNVSYNLKPIS